MLIFRSFVVLTKNTAKPNICSLSQVARFECFANFFSKKKIKKLTFWVCVITFARASCTSDSWSKNFSILTLIWKIYNLSNTFILLSSNSEFERWISCSGSTALRRIRNHYFEISKIKRIFEITHLSFFGKEMILIEFKLSFQAFVSFFPR